MTNKGRLWQSVCPRNEETRIYERLTEDGKLTGLRCPYYKHGENFCCVRPPFYFDEVIQEYKDCIIVDTRFHAL